MVGLQDAEAAFNARVKRIQDAAAEVATRKEENFKLVEAIDRRKAEKQELESQLPSEVKVIEDARHALAGGALDVSTTNLAKTNKDLEDTVRDKQAAILRLQDKVDELVGLKEEHEARILALYATDDEFHADDLVETAATDSEPGQRAEHPSRSTMAIKIESAATIEDT
ncbi:hypothetical protein DOTSEDRAFT_29273 [Dothistroma septosporum NZE10]|uniref:Uncharacterized protein n=1 Tax=Dothistroma septosporum (strain NZE10 / CBS 128990) TaxID=675120 RepID=N1PDC9_DOTSN|nr:hypothetical protein DOTSEDRAFT_29273 [Dothistroma septosporum NZE10]